jgi:uncharacterized cupin superfamily protein
VGAINLFSAEKLDGRIDVGRELQSADTAMYIYDLSPGQSSGPYHYEYEEEWLLVVDGAVQLRTPDGERTLQRGDLVCFPRGPAGAHQIVNRSDSPARTLMFSSSRVPAVSVYPDSDKIGVWPGNEADDLVFRRGTAVPWSDGETAA